MFLLFHRHRAFHVSEREINHSLCQSLLLNPSKPLKRVGARKDTKPCPGNPGPDGGETGTRSSTPRVADQSAFRVCHAMFTAFRLARVGSGDWERNWVHA